MEGCSAENNAEAKPLESPKPRLGWRKRKVLPTLPSPRDAKRNPAKKEENVASDAITDGKSVPGVIEDHLKSEISPASPETTPDINKGNVQCTPVASPQKKPAKRIPKRQRFTPTLKIERTKSAVKETKSVDDDAVVETRSIGLPDTVTDQDEELAVHDTNKIEKKLENNSSEAQSSSKRVVSEESETNKLQGKTPASVGGKGVSPLLEPHSSVEEDRNSIQKSSSTTQDSHSLSATSSVPHKKKFMPNLGPNVRQRSHPSVGNLSEDEGSQSEGYVSDHATEKLLTVNTVDAFPKMRVLMKKPSIIDVSDTSKATLHDLLYCNPANGKEVDTDDVEKEASVAEKTFEMLMKKGGSAGTSNEDPDDDDTNPPNDTSDNDDHVMAPQVKLAADGSIILNEESLYLEKTGADKDMSQTEIVFEEGLNSTRKKFRRTHWSLEVTLKFYKALSQVGTDFGLMAQMFPGFSRNQLKTKFKKEEKCNGDLVDRALSNRLPMDIKLFASVFKENDSEDSPTEAKDAKRKAP